MRRREFIAGLGGAAVWSVVACAQQAMPAIGWKASASSKPIMKPSAAMPRPTASQITPVRRSLSEDGATFTFLVRASMISGGTPLTHQSYGLQCIRCHWHPTEPNRERNSLGNSLVNSAGRANDFWSIKY